MKTDSLNVPLVRQKTRDVGRQSESLQRRPSFMNQKHVPELKVEEPFSAYARRNTNRPSPRNNNGSERKEFYSTSQVGFDHLPRNNTISLPKPPMLMLKQSSSASGLNLNNQDLNNFNNSDKSSDSQLKVKKQSSSNQHL